MGMTLAFWKGGDDLDASATYLALNDDQRVDGVAEVDAARVDERLRADFADWTVETNIWTAPAGAGAFDLGIGPQMVVFTTYGLDNDHLNRIIDSMLELDYPLYDPQIDERFA